MSSLILKDTGSTKIEPMEAGTYPAICCAIIDIGLQYSQAFDKESRQVILMFEIPSETLEINGETKSRTLSATYTFSFNDKSNLRRMLESWRSRAFTQEELQGFDLEKVLGMPCLITVINKTNQSGNTFSNIGSVSKMPKGFPVPKGREEPYLFDLGDKNWEAMMPVLPEWIQSRIRDSKTYKQLISVIHMNPLNKMSNEDLLHYGKLQSKAQFGGASEQTETVEALSDDDLPF